MYHISLKLFTKLEGLKTHQESKCKKKTSYENSTTLCERSSYATLIFHIKH